MLFGRRINTSHLESLRHSNECEVISSSAAESTTTREANRCVRRRDREPHVKAWPFAAKFRLGLGLIVGVDRL